MECNQRHATHSPTLLVHVACQRNDMTKCCLLTDTGQEVLGTAGGGEVGSRDVGARAGRCSPGASAADAP